MQATTVIDIKREHLGIFQSLIFEYERHRLPRLLRLKDKVDRGLALNEVDFEFLCKELNDACLAKHMIVSFPELEEFCLQMGHMFKELCEKAVENEKSNHHLS